MIFLNFQVRQGKSWNPWWRLEIPLTPLILGGIKIHPRIPGEWPFSANWFAYCFIYTWWFSVASYGWPEAKNGWPLAGWFYWPLAKWDDPQFWFSPLQILVLLPSAGDHCSLMLQKDKDFNEPTSFLGEFPSTSPLFIHELILIQVWSPTFVSVKVSTLLR
jgi:hypothetical protein